MFSFRTLLFPIWQIAFLNQIRSIAFFFTKKTLNQNRVRYSNQSHDAQWEAGQSENMWILLYRYQRRHFSLVQIDTNRWKHNQQSGQGFKVSVYSEDKSIAIMGIWQNCFIISYTYSFEDFCWLRKHRWFYEGV